MGLFDSKQKSSNTSTRNAAGFVAPWLTQATNDYGSLATPQAFSGDWQADLNPMLSGAWSNMFNNQAGTGFMNQAAGYGNAGVNAVNNLSGPGGAFQYNQGVYDKTMANLMPALQGSYDAATRDNNRDLNWNTLPGLDMASAFSGQQGGTKYGQGTALAQGMNADRNADIGAGLYQNAVNQAHGAAMSSGNQNLNANMSLANLGLGAMNNAFGMNQSMLNNQLMAGQGQQGYNQTGLDYDRMRWDMTQTNPWLYGAERLNNLANVGNMFGTTNSNSTSTSSPGLGNIGLQLGAAYLSGGGSLMAGGLGGMFGGGGGLPDPSSMFGSMGPTGQSYMSGAF